MKYSRLPNKRSATFINFLRFFQGVRSYQRGYVYLFQRFPSKIIKIVDKFGLNVQIFDVIGYTNLWGVCLFQGVHLLIFKIFPGGMFIQGGTFILESRVVHLLFSTFQNHHQSEQVSASFCKFVQVYASLCKFVQVHANLEKNIKNSISCHLHTIVKFCKSMLVIASLHKSVQVCASPFNS